MFVMKPCALVLNKCHWSCFFKCHLDTLALCWHFRPRLQHFIEINRWKTSGGSFEEFGNSLKMSRKSLPHRCNQLGET